MITCLAVERAVAVIVPDVSPEATEYVNSWTFKGPIEKLLGSDVEAVAANVIFSLS
jgi:hypothetical protein